MITGDPTPLSPADCQRQALHWQLAAIPDVGIEEAFKRLIEIYEFWKEREEDK